MMAHEIVVPDDLRERDQWVLWRNEERNGKGTKVPYQVSGRRASSVDPGTWTSFEAVTDEWRRNPNRYAGLGFVFSASDPFCGIDLDDSLDAEAKVKPLARGIVERFGDTYMEISPSGAGLKIWVRVPCPPTCPVCASGTAKSRSTTTRDTSR